METLADDILVLTSSLVTPPTFKYLTDKVTVCPQGIRVAPLHFIYRWLPALSSWLDDSPGRRKEAETPSAGHTSPSSLICSPSDILPITFFPIALYIGSIDISVVVFLHFHLVHPSCSEGGRLHSPPRFLRLFFIESDKPREFLPAYPDFPCTKPGWWHQQSNVHAHSQLCSISSSSFLLVVCSWHFRCHMGR